MISYINGVLSRKTASEIVLETGGIGYLVFVSAATLSHIGAIGENVRIHTYMKVTDDSISLYGFISEEELNMFNNLIGVNGIGPKNAMQILSHLSPDKIVYAILTEDTAALSGAPGVGKKTASRLILDLKDKFKSADILLPGITPQQTFEMTNSAVNDAIDALMALGYSQSESTRAVVNNAQEDLSSEQIIKLSLKQLASL